MGFPWRKVLSVGSGVGGIFIPGLASAIATVEGNLSGLKGPDKQKAAIAIATAAVTTLEGTLGLDVLSDPLVMQATKDFVNASVAVQNAYAMVDAAEASLRKVILDAQVKVHARAVSKSAEAGKLGE
jgi:hypothetical protein